MSALHIKGLKIKNLIVAVITVMSVGLIGYITMNWIVAKGLADRAHDGEALAAAVRALSDARGHTVEMGESVILTGATGEEGSLDAADAALRRTLQGLDRVEVLRPVMKSRIETLRQDVLALHDSAKSMARAYLHDGRPTGSNSPLTTAGDSFAVRSQAALKGMDDALDSLQSSLGAATEGLYRDERSARRMIVVAGAVLLALWAAAGGLLFLKVVPPLNRLLGALRERNSGNGNLTRCLPNGGRDEVGAVADELNLFLNQLQSLATGASRSGADLNRIATDMLSVTCGAEKGMLQQQDEVMHVVTAMNQMSVTVQDIAHNAARAAEAAERADKEALQGRQVVSQSKMTIGGLAEEVEQATRVILELETHSDNIGTILDVIRDIADQTNLLALNAAIEAARAGDQGRGFAVVAAEVRSLATRTQESTQQIKSMIERLQVGANNAVKVMESGRLQAQLSVQQAAEAESSLEAITAAVGTINEMNIQIASAAEEQSAVSAEINGNLHNIGEVAGQTTEAVKQSVELCGAVLQEWRQLQLRIARFGA